MKRYGNLWQKIVDFGNLLSAAKLAQQGKRFRPNVLVFNYNLERELFKLKEELESKTYRPGHYKTFEIVEPKRRMISAAPYRDRVVHHALCNIVVPIFEHTFIYNSYANRIGFGTHRALRKFTGFARSSSYVLQCDIKKYFPSIDHEILKLLVRNKIKCADTLWLIDTVIDNSNPQQSVVEYFPGDDLLSPLSRRRGLPIGNLSSQFFASVYLNGFDHFVLEQLKISKYVRYVDDFALFSDDRLLLQDARLAVEEYLVKLRVKIHPIKSQLFETKQGATFVGFRVFPDTIRVRQESWRRGRRRLRRLQREYANGEIELVQFARSLQSWVAHLQHGDTWNLRQTMSICGIKNKV